LAFFVTFLCQDKKVKLAKIIFSLLFFFLEKKNQKNRASRNFTGLLRQKIFPEIQAAPTHFPPGLSGFPAHISRADFLARSLGKIPNGAAHDERFSNY
jgi:hypothetical protein